ncbi:DUF4253 domain-containing protein [Streptomyces sp. NPDC088354]|uniref:DUF4253 domain-containing protein n=1 Tax=Streptomyces sp. NPDC088354 TaxID=3365856 RepID=UPI003807D39E
MQERTADQILGESWERYAREETADAGRDYPGRDTVLEVFGESAAFAEVVSPFGARWPGQAAAPAGPWADPEQLAAQKIAGLEEDEDGETALLERAYRSADLPALAEERDLGGCWPFDVAEMCTVLRSWEERFGIRLIGLEDDRVTVSVAAPVRTMSEAEAVAAEHFAFAPDNITQGCDESLGAYAAHQVLGRHVWSFWWD